MKAPTHESLENIEPLPIDNEAQAYMRVEEVEPSATDKGTRTHAKVEEVSCFGPSTILGSPGCHRSALNESANPNTVYIIGKE